jgi:hypothetical protein
MAYADPGSGAMFVQIILAGFIGVLFRVNSFIRKFRRRKVESTPPINATQKVTS